MIYEPNTTQWVKGDLVIHDCDAKQAYMLMRVIGFTRGGLVRTQYVERTRWGRTTWENEPRFLHDPTRFNIACAGAA